MKQIFLKNEHESRFDETLYRALRLARRKGVSKQRLYEIIEYNIQDTVADEIDTAVMKEMNDEFKENLAKAGGVRPVTVDNAVQSVTVTNPGSDYRYPRKFGGMLCLANRQTY